MNLQITSGFKSNIQNALAIMEYYIYINMILLIFNSGDRSQTPNWNIFPFLNNLAFKIEIDRPIDQHIHASSVLYVAI